MVWTAVLDTMLVLHEKVLFHLMVLYYFTCKVSKQYTMWQPTLASIAPQQQSVLPFRQSSKGMNNNLAHLGCPPAPAPMMNCGCCCICGREAGFGKRRPSEEATPSPRLATRPSTLLLSSPLRVRKLVTRLSCSRHKISSIYVLVISTMSSAKTQRGLPAKGRLSSSIIPSSVQCRDGNASLYCTPHNRHAGRQLAASLLYP